MGFTTHSFMIEGTSVVGDIPNHSNGNRMSLQIKDFLINTGQFTLVSTSGTPSSNMYYLFKFRDTRLHVQIYLYNNNTIKTSFGYYETSGAATKIVCRTVDAPVTTIGFTEFKVTIGDHFFEMHSVSLLGIETSFGWSVVGAYYKNTKSDDTLADPIETDTSKTMQLYKLIMLGNQFPTMTTDSKHLLSVPIFQKGIPQNPTVMSNFFIDENTQYLGEWYSAPSSLSGVSTNEVYTDAEGHQYFMSFFLSPYQRLMFVS